MKTTRDHAEVGDLRNLLGLDGTRPPMRKRWSHGIKAPKQDRRSMSWGRLRSKSKVGRDDAHKTTPEKVEEEEPKRVAGSPTI
jgi:hypothetical protein